MIKRYIEVVRTENKKTGLSRYFKTVCGTKQRISKKEYDFLYDISVGVCNLFNDSNSKVRRFYTSLVLDYKK